MSSVVESTSWDAYQSVARSASVGDRIPVELQLSVDDPFSAYQVVRNDQGSVYLETTGGQDGWGYFATDPIERITARVPAGSLTPETSPSLAALAGRLEAETLHHGTTDVPFPCGLFGWLSYDLVREIESLPQETEDDRGLPQLQFGVYDAVAAWREPRENSPTTLYLTSCPRLGEVPRTTYERGLEQATTLATKISNGLSNQAIETTNGTTGTTFESTVGREAYADRVNAIKQYIRDGDTFQVNISHRLEASATVPPIDVYAALRRVNPAPYSGLIEFPGVDLISASPELLISVDGNDLLTEPIAGTRPRGGTPERDSRLAEELASDEKERAEHAMLVDLERNDLGKVSTYGSVTVEEYRRIDRYSEVMHLVSLVKGELRKDVSLAGVCRANPLEPTTTSAADRLCAAIAAMFPGGTITGAPKPRTMEIIEELESSRRGPYTGSMAIIGFDQRAVLNIIIRTIVKVNDTYYLRVGAGIVHDSVPEREYDETMDKARALLNAVNEALDDDTTLEVVS